MPLGRLIVHDLSKFSRAEWGPYADRFCSGRSGQTDKGDDPEAFQKAWEHHWAHNPHHWEYWCGREMPETYVREMVADWMGASRGITGGWNITPWFLDNYPKIELHPLSWGTLADVLRERSKTGLH